MRANPEQSGELRKFVAPEFVFGRGARALAGRYARNFGARKALVVSDRGVVAAGWAQQVIDSLAAEGVSAVLFQDVTPNPRAQEVMLGAKAYDDEACQMVVAVGGGSPIDCAKGICIVSANGGDILDYEGVDRVAAPGPPLVCIPTTAGSAADVSQFAIITDTQRRVKIAIISKMTVPDAALIDPETTTTMDRALTAATGLDVLSHSMEAYVSNASSAITDVHALRAMELVSQNLIRAAERPGDLEARTQMSLASLHAGLAFSNASLGLVHAMAHAMGGMFDSCHGECNAMLLEYIVDFNWDAAADRYVRAAGALGVAGDRASLLRALGDLRRGLGVADRPCKSLEMRAALSELGARALRDPCLVTNPRQATLQQVEALYERLF